MSPIISIIRGKCKTGKALLDSTASVNLLSYLVFKEIGLGELNDSNLLKDMIHEKVE
jgi:hypothetical protein